MSKRTQKSIQTLPTSRSLQAVDAAFDLRFDLRLQCLRALRAIDAHHAQSFEVWKKVTVGGYIAVVLSGIYAFAGSHHHHHSPEYSYLRIRTKAYTWRCPDCTLFDGACWEKCDKEGR